MCCCLALQIIMWLPANNDRSSSCPTAGLYNNAGEDSAECSQDLRLFCACFIWHSQVAHTTKKITALMESESVPLLDHYGFTSFDKWPSPYLTSAAVKGCGVVLVLSESSGGNWVGYSESHCGLRREKYRLHLRSWQVALFQLVLMARTETFKQLEEVLVSSSSKHT